MLATPFPGDTVTIVRESTEGGTINPVNLASLLWAIEIKNLVRQSGSTAKIAALPKYKPTRQVLNHTTLEDLFDYVR